MTKEIDEDFAKIFQDTTKLINDFIDQTAILSISALSKLNPSIEEMAHAVKLLSDWLKLIASEPFYDENKATNIFQCSLIMGRMSDAVEQNDIELYRSLAKELEQHTK